MSSARRRPFAAREPPRHGVKRGIQDFLDDLSLGVVRRDIPEKDFLGWRNDDLISDLFPDRLPLVLEVGGTRSHSPNISVISRRREEASSSEREPILEPKRIMLTVLIWSTAISAGRPAQ
jgi:hypothetical protein